MKNDLHDVTRITEAANLLRNGVLVAFPTETVYGLGADATSDPAVRKIFAAKGRPATNPLIVHVADVAAAKKVVTDWPDAADRLAERFWPGPLTLVLPKAACIANVVTAGGSTVGVRVPNHPLALALLRAVDRPIAAPSANSSERISPTTALHVKLDLGDKVDLVLDGGPCDVGIESTVLDLSVIPPMVLRPGGVTRAQIESIIGPVNLPDSMTEPNAKSPGRGTRHYAPRTPAYRFEAGTMPTATAGIVTMSIGAGTAVMPDDPDHFAAQLYDTLRQLDGANATAIWVELPPDEPRWLAVRDRLLRATQPIGGGDVACPMCSYNLRGLTEPRCPECGFKFDWAELLDPLRQKHPYLFEHHPEANVWSFFRTQVGGWKPKEFWTSLHPAQPSNRWRLFVYAVLCVTPCVAALTAIFAMSIIVYVAFSGHTLAITLGVMPQLFRESITEDGIAWACCICLLWPLLSAIGLMVFQWSMRRARVRQIHVLRCVIYGADLLTVFGLVYCVYAASKYVQPGQAMPILGFDLGQSGNLWITAFVALFSLRLVNGYRRYLRFDHAIATVLASQLMAGLVAWKLFLVTNGY